MEEKEQKMIYHTSKVGWLRLMACVYGNKDEFVAAYNYGKTGADNTNQSVFFAWVEGTLPVGQSTSYFKRLAAKRHKKKTI